MNAGRVDAACSHVWSPSGRRTEEGSVVSALGGNAAPARPAAAFNCRDRGHSARCCPRSHPSHARPGTLPASRSLDVMRPESSSVLSLSLSLRPHCALLLPLGSRQASSSSQQLLLRLLDRLLLLLGAPPNHSVMECLIIHFLLFFSLCCAQSLSPPRPACSLSQPPARPPVAHRFFLQLDCFKRSSWASASAFSSTGRKKTASCRDHLNNVIAGILFMC